MGEHNDEAALTADVARLQSEVATLRQRLEHVPGQVHALEERLVQTSASLATATTQNERLAATLREAREQITALKEEVEQLAQPPSGFGVFISPGPDEGTADIFVGGRKMRVNVSPNVNLDDVKYGQEVVLNEGMNIVRVEGFETVGEVVMYRETLEDGLRALIISRADEERVVTLAEPLLVQTLRAGDSLLLDPRTGYVYEKIPKPEAEELVLEEVPDIEYIDIGGLADQIEQIRDAIELPYLHADLFREHRLKAPKGILLYGPPGCGKTLIAKAVANSLAKQVLAKAEADAASRGEKLSDEQRVKLGTAGFLNIKGPELLNKYVGETERHIRLVFQRAREKASEGMPVIVFFDEMDSIFRTRGSGVSSDMENTIVPQFLSEIDGVEGLENVVVIGATNREDMIDPAVLRPGRLDVKIKVQRPDAEAAKDILTKYVVTDLPLHADDLRDHGGNRSATVDAMIQRAVEKMYAKTEENQFLEVTYANGDKEILYFKDFNSGAMLENIVARAKQMAIKRFLDTGQKGIRVSDLLAACLDEFKENEDLPNTTNPDDWARISGKKGERIVYIRTLVANDKNGMEGGMTIDTVANTGQYL